LKRCLVLVGVLCLIPASQALAQPTRAIYIAQADPVCISSAQAESGPASGALTALHKGRFKAAARGLRRASVIFSAGVDQLAVLERPPADASLLGTWIDSLRAQVPVVNSFARALTRGQVKRIRRSASQLIIAEDNSAALVGDYGFLACDRFGA
jgi:hypothetical protein